MKTKPADTQASLTYINALVNDVRNYDIEILHAKSEQKTAAINAGKALATRRIASGISQRALSAIMNMSTSHVGGIESGVVMATRFRVKAYLDAIKTIKKTEIKRTA
jgi:hypothetical protein